MVLTARTHRTILTEGFRHCHYPVARLVDLASLMLPHRLPPDFGLPRLPLRAPRLATEGFRP